MGIESSKAYVQNIPLAKTPSISFHIRTKIKFRNFTANGAQHLLLMIHLEFRFLCSYSVFCVYSRPCKLCDGAEMASGAHDEPCSDVFIHDPAVARSFQSL